MAIAPDELKRLIDLFSSNFDDYTRGTFNETQARIQFIDPLFRLLGWDINNAQGYAEKYKDVVHEDLVKVGASSKAPDYSFRVGGYRKFFLEAKRPSVDVKSDMAAAFQLRRYGWTATLPLSILTNFKGLAIYDCRIKPKPGDKASVARIEYIPYDEYIDKWDYLQATFSKEAINRGSFDKYVIEAPRRRGTAEFDTDFLETIEQWRADLAANIAIRNPSIDVRELNRSVQNTIDRIIFLRIAEDRGIEPAQRLLSLGKKNYYRKLIAVFQLCDDRYNSGLFHFKKDKESTSPADSADLELKIDDDVIFPIIQQMYPPLSSYAFDVIPAEILGQVYERFLGKTIVLDERTATVENKPEVRKAGGVFYTPSYVVRHIVETTVQPRLEGRTPSQVAGKDRRIKNAAPVRIIDPACGSGSFLIVAYQHLLDWYLAQYLGDDPDKFLKGKSPELFQSKTNEFRLSVTERKRILLTHIYGVDIDSQAVEVTKLSLLLKVLEGENNDELASQMDLFRARVLPDLAENIRCGNSLVGTDIYRQKTIKLDDDDEFKINPLDWKSFLKEVTGDTGFDAVIGNPPYILLEDTNRQAKTETYFADHYDVAGFKVDTYHLFIEKAVQITKTGGAASYIVPSNFMTNNHSGKLRRLLVADGHLKEIVNFRGRVFKDASVDTCIFLHDSRSKHEDVNFITAEPMLASFKEISRIALSVKQILATESTIISARTVNDEVILEQANKVGVPLKEIAYVNFGKQLRDRETYPQEVITLAPTQPVPKGYARCYTGRDAKRYLAEWSGLACKTSRASKAGGCWDPERLDAVNKIVVKQVGSFPTYGLDERGYQCLNTMFMVNVLDVSTCYYVLGILNSSLLKYIWLKQFYDQRTTFPKIKGGYLKELPIVKFDAKSHSALRIEECVVDLLARMKRSLTTASERVKNERRMIALEEEIDDEVFSLYGINKSAMAKVRNYLDTGLY